MSVPRPGRRRLRVLYPAAYLVAVAGGAFAGAYPLNQCEPAPAPTDPRRQIADVGVPVIRMMSQSDYLRGIGSRRPDSDVAPDQFRLLERRQHTHHAWRARGGGGRGAGAPRSTTPGPSATHRGCGPQRRRRPGRAAPRASPPPTPAPRGGEAPA